MIGCRSCHIIKYLVSFKALDSSLRHGQQCWEEKIEMHALPYELTNWTNKNLLPGGPNGPRVSEEREIIDEQP